MPRYPTYPSQPYTGDVPTMVAVGPPDAAFSSGTAPYWAAKIDRLYGRHLAGADDVKVQDEQSIPAWATNELNYLAEMDDVQGNGVFDPPGTHSNIHPDAGIFSARFDIPGYLARERLYAESEVVDSTTGRPVVYVNSGAVAMDSAAQIAFIENNAYRQPEPLMSPLREGRMRARETWNVRQNPVPIGAIGDQAASAAKALAVAGVIGLAIGAAYAAMKKRRR